MLFDMFVIFLIVTFICLIFSVFLMEDKPLLAIPFITIGMLFSIMCTYAMWDIEFYSNIFNSTNGSSTLELTHITSYGDPYSYVFMLIFFIFLVLFFRTGFNMWRIALESEDEMDIKTKK